MAEAAQPCDECGSAMPVWYAPNELWNRIVGSPSGFLCPDCFNHACEAAGELLIWRAGRAGEVEDLEAQLEDPAFWQRFKANLPPAVRPSTIDLSMALHVALAALPTEQPPSSDPNNSRQGATRGGPRVARRTDPLTPSRQSFPLRPIRGEHHDLEP